MVYLVHGSQSLTIKKHIQKLIEENLEVIDDFSCAYFDCEEASIDAIMHDVDTLPLGYEKKVVVARNAYFFTEKFPKKDNNDDEDYAHLKKYIQSNDAKTTLIFSANVTKISDKKGLLKVLKAHGKVVTIADLKDHERPLAIKKILEKKNIQLESKKVFDSLMERIGTDWESIANDIQKLELLNETITLESVEALISRPLEDNIFGIIDAIVDKDIEKALSIFYDLRVQNEDPVSLLPRMAAQLRHMYQVFYLKNKGYNDAKITSELNVHPYRVTLALQKRSRISEKKILKMIHDLAVLDLEIKSGIAEKYQAFEMFLVRYA